MLDKSKNNHFLDHPFVKDHLNKVFPVIVKESDRGAVLLAASQLDLVLEEALKKIAPKSMSKTNLTPLFNFSGPLGTFSSKINMAYYFRIINKDVWKAINCLRKVRNIVAHECIDFSLKSYSDKIDAFYNIGINVPDAINKWSNDVFWQNLIAHSLNLGDPTVDENKKLFNGPEEVSTYINNNPELRQQLEMLLPKWKLGLGTVLICGITHYGAEKAVEILGENETFSSINKKLVKLGTGE